MGFVCLNFWYQLSPYNKLMAQERKQTFFFLFQMIKDEHQKELHLNFSLPRFAVDLHIKSEQYESANKLKDYDFDIIFSYFW